MKRNLSFWDDKPIDVSSEIFKRLEFDSQIEKMEQKNVLFGVIKKFTEIDLSPATVDSVKMEYVFEDLMRKFYESAEAGKQYTGGTSLSHDACRASNHGLKDSKTPSSESNKTGSEMKAEKTASKNSGIYFASEEKKFRHEVRYGIHECS